MGLILESDVSHAELLEEKAAKLGSRPSLKFKGEVISYKEKQVPEAMVRRILEAGRFAPSVISKYLMK